MGWEASNWSMASFVEGQHTVSPSSSYVTPATRHHHRLRHVNISSRPAHPHISIALCTFRYLLCFDKKDDTILKHKHDLWYSWLFQKNADGWEERRDRAKSRQHWHATRELGKSWQKAHSLANSNNECFKRGTKHNNKKGKRKQFAFFFFLCCCFGCSTHSFC